MIYFLTCEPWGLYPVKVGFARVPAVALAEAQPWCPFRLEIFAVVEGGRPELAELLKTFALFGLEGDWFYPDGIVKATMRKARAAMGDLPWVSVPAPPRLRTALRYAEILSEIQRAPTVEDQESAAEWLRAVGRCSTPSLGL